ncbi:two-component response regulator-like APRR9 isoform X3 [Hevea brasiliensis]|nr:two-component response regulator-like APRR9 isoform X3 [Hevea brasiliensis]
MSVFENEGVSSGGGMEVQLRTEEEAEKKKETENKDDSSEVVLWEKFLPRMVLRVLLVEADDSTRQIIAALLRKCSYIAVVAVPDGLMAWEALKGRPHNIDLILTEVELPSISGYALLTLVMEHDICKNIPVIMMSSHNSISLVLKCMLKGAADFLIKPVRKNELRNLWQHVWRRQTHKVESTFENNSTSDHCSDCATFSHKRKECSEKRSDAQGLSQMKYSSESNLSNTEKEKYKECAVLDKRAVNPESKTGDWSTQLGLMSVSCNEAYNLPAQKLGEHACCAKSMIQDESTRPENIRGNANASQGHNNELVESSSGTVDLIGSFDNGPKRIDGHTSINDGTNKFEFTPWLELSLRRSFPNSSKNQGADEKHLLNHTNASSFSRYNSKMLQPLFPTSTSNFTKFKEDASKSLELSPNHVSQNISSVSQRHSASLNGSQEIMTTMVVGHSGQAELAHSNPQQLIRIPGVRLDNLCTRYGHVIPPVYHRQTGLPPAWSPKLASQREHSPFSTSIHSNSEIQDSEQNNRQSEETTTNSVDQSLHQQNNMELAEELRHGSPAASQSTSSSMCNGIADDSNSSAYGSFCSRHEGSATLVVASEKAMVPERVNDGGFFVYDRFKGMDSHRFSQREAALTKFRLKRKDRCYEKKVRYQSRKRLAEQRPRVKGQFVRQVQNDLPMADANN